MDTFYCISCLFILFPSSILSLAMRCCITLLIVVIYFLILFSGLPHYYLYFVAIRLLQGLGLWTHLGVKLTIVVVGMYDRRCFEERLLTESCDFLEFLFENIMFVITFYHMG